MRAVRTVWGGESTDSIKASCCGPYAQTKMARPSDRRTRKVAYPSRRHRRWGPAWLVLALSTPLLYFASLHLSASVLRRANALGRRCMTDPPDPGEPAATRPRIAMVSLSDESSGGVRPFRGVMDAVRSNKVGYAAAWGYDFIDAGDKLEPSRPPSWSKILAIRSQLARYDWVFWNDADSLVTNPNISLEGVLRAAIGHGDLETSPDLVVTEDINGINAGMFFVRRSRWSEGFLDVWWSQADFVRFNSTKSGDNDALNHLVGELPPEERRRHVRVAPMQCLFNSYLWLPKWKSAHRLVYAPGTAWRGAYSSGDFMVHLAGLDDKMSWVEKILQQETA